MSRLVALAAVLVSAGCVASSSTGATSQRIKPVRIPRAAVVGVAWRAVISADLAPTIVASGPGRITAKAMRTSSRRFRVALTFPRAGRWTLVARAGRDSARLGAVAVDIRPTPLLDDVFGLAAEPAGTLLVGQVHNGGIVRATVTGSTARVVPDVSVFHLSVGRSGTVYVTLHDNGGVYRLGSRNELEPLGFPHEAGIAVEGADGVYALHGNRLLRRSAGGQISVVADGFSNALALAVGNDGAVFVGDAGTGTIKRLGSETEVVARDLGYVVSVAVAPDGTIWSSSVAEGGRPGVWRTAPGGAPARLLDKEVSAVAVGADGTVFACAFRERRVLRLDPATNRWETILRSR